MPFKSKQQRSFLYAKHPKVAKEWAEKYGSDTEKPKKKKSPWTSMKPSSEKGK